MKKIYTLLLAAICSTAVQAQSRIVSIHTAVNDGTQYKTYDSVAITYNTGNANHGGPFDYMLGNLKHDENTRVRPNASTGVLYTSEQKNYEYDANWNKTKYTLQIPYPQNTDPLTNNYQEHYTYDVNNNETLRVGLKWNPFNSAWDTTNRETRSYDANNNILFLNTELYYTPNGFRGNLRRSYDYDANNNMILYVAESWVTASSAYDTFSRQIFHYNANQENDTMYFENFNRTTRMWEPSSKAYYVYTNGQISEYTHQFWVNGQWENRYLTLTNINSATNMIMNEYKNWDVTNSVWENSTKDSTYDISSNPRVNETIYYTWNTNTSVYDTTSRVRTSYNADNYPTVGVRNTWDAANSQWMIATGDDSTVWRYENTTGSNINNVGNDAPTVTLYPNPASGHAINLQANISSSYTVATYNMQGVLVAQQQVPTGTQEVSMPIAHLASGQYILSVKSKEGNTSKLFSVVR